ESVEYLIVGELIAEGLAGSALLDAVQAGKVALVRDLPRDIERRAEIAGAGRRRRGRGAAGCGCAGARRFGHRSILPQTLLPHTGDESRSLTLDHATLVAEALFQPPGYVGLARARLDLPHHGSGSRIQRVDLLRPRLEQHAAELLFTEL